MSKVQIITTLIKQEITLLSAVSSIVPTIDVNLSAAIPDDMFVSLSDISSPPQPVMIFVSKCLNIKFEFYIHTEITFIGLIWKILWEPFWMGLIETLLPFLSQVIRQLRTRSAGDRNHGSERQFFWIQEACYLRSSVDVLKYATRWFPTVLACSRMLYFILEIGVRPIDVKDM